MSPLSVARSKEKPVRGVSTRMELSVAIIATAVALALHAHLLRHSPALWRDEINSVNLASLPSLSSVYWQTEFESFPPMWTLLLRAWMAIGAGSTDFGLRLFGLCGGLAVLFAVWFGVQRLSQRVPLIALALIAVNPEIIRWGDSVRAWGLAAALAVIALAMVYRTAQSPTTTNVALAAVVAILCVHCAWQNAILLAAIVLGTIVVLTIQGSWKRAGLTAGIGVVAAASLLLYAPVINRVSQWNMLSRRSFTIQDYIARTKDVMVASGSTGLWIWRLLIVGALVAGVISLFRRRGGAAPDNSREDASVGAAAVMVAALIGLAAFYMVLGYPTQSWYYLALLVLVASTAEIAVVCAVRSSVFGAARLVIAMMALVAGFMPAWQSLEGPQTNMDAVGARLKTESANQDIVILHPWYYAIAFDRYYDGPAKVTTIPPLEDRKLHRYDLVKHAMESTDPTPALLKDVQRTLESGHKVWLIGHFTIPPAGARLQPLPAPPLPDTGWQAERYTDLWAQELGAFLRDHALTERAVPIGTPGGRFEAANAAVFEGWKM